MRRLARRADSAFVGLGLVAIFFLQGPAEQASASCAPPVAISSAVAQSDVVVVGTVVATRSRGRIATLAVDEVWTGQVDNTFEVYGGPPDDNTATSVDRTYDVGTRDLLFAYEPRAHGSSPIFGGRYEDNDCSNTQPWNETLAAFRPGSATIVSGPVESPRAHPASSPQPRSDDSRVREAAGLATVAGLATRWPLLMRRRSSAAAVDV